MSDAQAIQIGREALTLVLLLAAPVLGIGLLAALVTALLQALTQVQEQTLSLVPKIVAMLGATILLGPWMLGRLVEFSQRMFGGMW